MSSRQWLAVDVMAAIFIFVSARSVSFVHRSSDDFVLALICSLAVIGRRKWPLPSLAVVTLSFATLTGLNGAPIGLSVALALVAYTAASRERRPVSIWALVAAEIALAISIGAMRGRGTVAQTAIESLLVLAAAWFVGDSISARRATSPQPPNTRGRRTPIARGAPSRMRGSVSPASCTTSSPTPWRS